MRRPGIIASGIFLVAFATPAGIEDTVHNLGSGGPGDVRALTEERICVFCHAPHRTTGAPPLWNRGDSTASYLLYDSTTFDAAAGQPTGASRMCLSCHDGTVALGDVASEPSEIDFAPERRFLDPATGSLSTDLGDDHPVSFPYDASLASQDPELADPLTIPLPITLDGAGELQCTSCHDPHDDLFGDFLRLAPTGGALCTACHVKTDWPTSVHATSTAAWNGTTPDPWPDSSDATVADNDCRSCHGSHSAAQPARLVKRAPEEDACFVCHNGNVAALDLELDFTKPYRHPVDMSQGVHDPLEDPLLAPRHVECIDCHDPHQARNEPAMAPVASGALRGVSGIDTDGLPVEQVSFQYEVCFACHGDGTSTNQAIPRTAGEINTRLEFEPSAVSFHPVVQAGKNSDVPSLVPPLTEASQIYCSDCHASDTAGSGGSQGPHGSLNRFLLRDRYETEDGFEESPELYALCYRCHSRDVLFDKDLTGFEEHEKHVIDEAASCSACHDPHGVAATAGTPANNSHLISFDTRIVSPSGNVSGVLEFVDLGFQSGSCTLACHGEDHDGYDY